MMKILKKILKTSQKKLCLLVLFLQVHPVAPTPTTGDNTTQIATTAFVKASIDNLVDGASSALDTLNELSTAINDDANFASTITNSLATKADLTGATFTGTVNMLDLSANDVSFNSIFVDTISEKTTATGVTIDSVLLKDNQITAHTITAQNYKVGNVNFISASRQGNFRDLEVKNSSNTETILLTGDGGHISINGTLSADTISEKTSANGTVINGVTIKNNGITAGSNGTISATNYNIGSQYIVSAARQALFTGLEIKHGTTNDLNIHLQEDGDAEFMGDISANKGIFSTNVGIGTTNPVIIP